MRRRRLRLSPILAAWVLTAAAGMPAGAAPGPLINSGHSGAITDLEYDARRRLLFSAGDDGSVRVWEHGSGTIVQHLFLGVHRVARIALQPEGTLLAAVLRSAAGDDLLEVWDWRSGRRLYGRALTEPPLHLGFSSRGTALVYTRAQLDSVVFLDARSGRPLPRLPPGIGIVSFVTTSTNERTIMTYQPTGRIRYWDAAGAGLQAEVTTLPGLEQIAVSADNTLLVARSGGEIVAIDVVTGQVRRRLTPVRPAVFAVSHLRPQLILLETAPPAAGGGVRLRRIRLDRGLTGDRGAALELTGAVSVIAAADYSVFMAQPGGIAEYRSGAVRTFARDELLPEAHLAIAGDTLVVASGARLALFRTALPAASPGGRGAAASTPPLPRVLSQQQVPNPLPAPVGLTVAAPAAQQGSATPPAVVLLWNREGEAGALGTLDPRSGAFQLRLTGLPAPLVQVSVLERHLLLLDRAGELGLYSLAQVLDADPDQPPPPEHRFRLPGANKVAGGGRRLVVGRSSAPAGAAPLLRIDTATAETILLPDEALLIYDLAQHAAGDLFTLGVESAPAGSGPAPARTVLKRRTGGDLIRQYVLDSYAGEDLFAALAAAPDGRSVYSSLGQDTVRVWDGRRLQELERSGHRPRRLAVAGGVLVAHNADGTFTVWDRAARAVLFDLYLFRDFEWLVVERSGRYAHSAGARRYLSDGSRRLGAARLGAAAAGSLALARQ